MPSEIRPPIDQTKSFWECVEAVCKVAERGRQPSVIVQCRARQVLDQMERVKKTGRAETKDAV